MACKGEFLATRKRRLLHNRGESFYKNDPKRMYYIREVQRGKSKEFLKDVAICAKYKQKPSDFKGKCGKVLCSKEYIDHMEHHVFGRNVSDYYLSSRGDTAYGQGIKKALENVAKQIDKDFDRINNIEEEYLSNKYKNKMRILISSFDKCGINHSRKTYKRLDELYSDIRYLNEMDMIPLLPQYNEFKPTQGVEGRGIAAGVGVGAFFTGQAYLVKDALGNVGIIFATGAGAGAGFGVSIGFDRFHYKTMKDIFELEAKAIDSLGVNFALGSASFGYAITGQHESVNVGWGILDAFAGKAGKKIVGVTGNVQMYFSKLYAYKKVTK